MNCRKNFLLDLLCVGSVVGLWPRYIEPKLLLTTHLEIPFRLPRTHKAVRLVQISDLHFNQTMAEWFLRKILRKICQINPDLIVITGDFLCYGQFINSPHFSHFLHALQAPLGVYAVLGNHDFSEGLSINSQGDYDVGDANRSPFITGFQRLLASPLLTGIVTERAKNTFPEPQLLEALKAASIHLLDNTTVQIKDLFNLTGLSEYMAGRVDVDQAYQHYDKTLPGVILAHNPDLFSALKTRPGHLVLSGHTHGGQINLPYLWRRFCALENPQYKTGSVLEADKHLYVSRGLGGVYPFRFNSPPEIVDIILKNSGD